jgi:iron complex transport system ATP-binding protein
MSGPKDRVPGPSGRLSLSGVQVALGGVPVLAGLDLTLEPGELLLLAGRNGAGKTTLLRVAAGLVRPDPGQALLDGRPLAGFTRRQLGRRIAFVSQETGVPFPFTAGQLVLLGRTPHLGLLAFESKADVAAAEAALARLGLEALADRSVLALSGGERQLVQIARALAQEAELLLLDEPTAHLDLAHRALVLGCLRELAREGRAVLIVSHDLAAASYANRVAFLSGGRILAAGPPAQVIQPDLLRATFGVEAEVLATAGGPVVWLR